MLLFTTKTTRLDTDNWYTKYGTNIMKLYYNEL